MDVCWSFQEQLGTVDGQRREYACPKTLTDRAGNSREREEATCLGDSVALCHGWYCGMKCLLGITNQV